MDHWEQIFYISGSLLTAWWLFLYIRGARRYKEMSAKVSDKLFMKDFFGIGYSFLDLIHYRCDTAARRKQIRKIAEVEDERSAEQVFLALRAGELTYLFTALPVGLYLAILSETPEAGFVGLIFSVAGVVLLENSYNRRVEQKREEVLMQLPSVLSKLILLMNSGMILRDAWRRAAACGNGALYMEMQKVTEEIRNGRMEVEAYQRFAERCSGREIRKFTAIIQQNLSKGNIELLHYLQDLSIEMWEVKKNAVQKKADAAVRRLIFPMILVFGTVLVMIIVPMLSGIGF